MLKNRIFYLLLLILTAVIYIFTNTYETLTLLLALMILPLVSLVFMLIAGTRLTLAPEVPDTMTKEQAVFVLQFENHSPFPIARTGLRIILENEMTGLQSQRQVYVSIGGRSKVAASMEIRDVRAGIVSVSVQKVCIYDSFGIFAFKKTPPEEKTSVVYPALLPMGIQLERPTETMGEGIRYALDRTGSDVSELFALREYGQGDEIRKIHWKLSSKLDKTMVRDFSMPLNYSIFLLLELTSGEEAVLDAQIELYLSMSKALLENGINHNLAWYNSGNEEFCVRELNDFTDFELVSAQVLSAYAYDDQRTALNFYRWGNWKNPLATLLYVATNPDLDVIAELEVIQNMRTIWIQGDPIDSRAELEGVISVTVSQVNRGLTELII